MSNYRLCMYIFLILFVILTLAVASGTIDEIDNTALHDFHGYGGIWLQGITIFGGTYFLIGSSLLIIFSLLLTKRYTRAFLFSSVLGIALFSYQAVKEVIARPRPELICPSAETLPFLSIYSYPSGHTVGSMTFFLGIYLFVLKRDFSLKKIIPIIVVPSLVAMGMVSRGDHYPSDVIGGLLLSSIVILFVFELTRIYDVAKYVEQALDVLRSYFGFKAD